MLPECGATRTGLRRPAVTGRKNTGDSAIPGIWQASAETPRSRTGFCSRAKSGSDPRASPAPGSSRGRETTTGSGACRCQQRTGGCRGSLNARWSAPRPGGGFSGSGRPKWRLPEDHRKMGRTLPHRRYRRSAGPILPAAQAAPACSGICHSPDRNLAAPVMDRPTDRHRTWHLSVHRQSHFPPPRAEQDQGYRPPPTAAALRAQQTRRDDPHRHQEVGVLQGPRASNHRMAHRHAPKRGRRMGIPARLHRRLFPRGFLRCDARPNRPKRNRRSPGRRPYYQNFGITIERVMTDNGPCYTSKIFRNLCTELDIRHIRTRPYTPRTNGKAERFIQTALREWAYAVAYQTSTQRGDQLPAWLHRYNWHHLTGVSKSRYPSADWAWAGTTY